MSEYLDDLWQQFNRARNARDYALAASTMEEILRQEPECSAFWAIQGRNYAALQRWHDAEDAYLRAISLNSENVTARVALGWMYCQRHMWSEAETSLRAALKLKPEHAEANCLLGLALMSMGSLEQAMACFQRTIVNDPHNYEAYHYMGSVLLALGRRDAAINAFQEAIRINPTFRAAVVALGDTTRGEERRLDGAPGVCEGENQKRG